MTRRAIVGLVAVVVAAGCGPRDDVETARASDVASIVVYAAEESDVGLSARFAGFTRETGIHVTIRAGTPDDVIANRGSPPADVLLTGDVAGIWRAADEGALIPMRGEALRKTIESKVPPALRDPDAAWVAAAVRRILIARRDGVDGVDSYASLAGDPFRGRLCLTSSDLPANRTLIAMLIEEQGERAAELMVRGWVQNLALPVFARQSALVAAIAAGDCDVGIVALTAEEMATTGIAGVGLVEPQPLYVDIDGIGVARHARAPDDAMRFIEWYLERMDGLVDAAGGVETNVGAAGWRAVDADRLAERAGYR